VTTTLACDLGAGSLKALAWLSVEDNQLSTLPTELSQLCHLEYLSIYNNMQITALPLCMFSFKSLRCFRANQFFQVPKELLTGASLLSLSL
jgi:Leucine-rich repeat (LRR) protein